MINYSDDEKALIFLSQFDFMTSAKFKQVLSYFNNPKDIFLSEPQKLYQLKDILKKNYEILVDNLANFKEDIFFAELDKRGINVLTIVSKNYPTKLLKLQNPPYVLYYVGDLSLLNKGAVAIVGTRAPSSYGKIVTEKFSKTLAQNNLCIISGLATGVDKIAHECALEVNGKTIAVMGGGFDHIFPSQNINLAREIGKRGLIVTEYYLKTKPAKYTFPYRNRIIAALSDAILITEAKTGSGSLYTKEYADEIGIETYAIPGNITSEKSGATNMLIKSGSAYCTTSPSDILKQFGIKESKKETTKKVLQLSTEQATIVEFLKDGEKDFEFLQEKTNYSTQTLNFNLTSMEISGIIKKLAGNTYVLTDE